MTRCFRLCPAGSLALPPPPCFIKGAAYHTFGTVLAWIVVSFFDSVILGRGGIGGGHLKLATSNLKGASALSSFLPVVTVLGRLKIEVIDAK